jgi:hypothetical protein
MLFLICNARCPHHSHTRRRRCWLRGEWEGVEGADAGRKVVVNQKESKKQKVQHMLTRAVPVLIVLIIVLLIVLLTTILLLPLPTGH